MSGPLVVARPLTRSDHEYAIERAVSHVQGRYVERRIRAAATDADALAVAREECRNWGSWCGDLRVDGFAGGGRGLLVQVGGREGLVRWRELVEAVRGGGQLDLFAA